MVDDEGQIWILKRGFLDVFGICQVTKRARLIRESLMHAEELEAELSRLLVKLRRVVVVDLEAATRLARIEVAIPLPRTDLVKLHFPFHLFIQRGPVWLVLRFVPVVVGRAVALSKSANASGQLIDVVSSPGHQPAWKARPAASRTFQDLARFVAHFLFGWDAADHRYRRLAVEEDLFQISVEAVGFSVSFQIETHVLEKLIGAKASIAAAAFHPKIVSVREMRLHVDDEVIALWPLFGGGLRLEGLDWVHLPVIAVDLVHSQNSRRKPHRCPHEIATRHAEPFGVIISPLADQMLDVLLLFVLWPRKILFVGHDLRWNGRIYSLPFIAFVFRNPHTRLLSDQCVGFVIWRRPLRKGRCRVEQKVRRPR